jgi:hypothetical protein
MPKQPKRLRLKGWLQGESLREQIKDSKSTDEIVECLYSYLTLIYKDNDWDKETWMDVSELFYLGCEANLPTIPFPMLRNFDKAESNEAPWEYINRSWYLWANTFASKYGWSLEYIAELEIDDAIGLMQEVLIDEQLDREWEWDLSEITYSYDTNTKQSKHAEYPRPQWMLPEHKETPTIKIPKNMIPQGLVISEFSDVKH